MKKDKITPKNKLPYIDYECKVGERVWWQNFSRQRFEGKILQWKDEESGLIAVVQLDDNSIMEVKC